MNKLNVFLYGGIGNQMFQYAFARKLCIKYDLILNLNLYGFKIDDYYKRNFDLKNFNINYQSINENYSLKFNLCRIIQHFPVQTKPINIFFKNLKVEKKGGIQNNLININKNKENFLYGYWQNEQYFEEVRELILNEFTLKIDFTPLNLKIQNEILHKNNYIAVHVRMLHMKKTESKEDFDSNTNLKYRVSESYYMKAFQYIIERVANPIFYVFSDRPDSAESFFKSFELKFVFLNNNRGSDYEDLILMSKFQHQIIANSSFSWWGAWLGQKNGQIVIAPKNTLFTPEIPSKWIQI